jgi:hypothetical protein
MKQNFTLYIWKRDRRTRSGERLYSTTVWNGFTQDTMDNEMRALRARLYPTLDGWRLEAVPTTKWVKNLMTGEQVEIAHDTPRSCDPSSELYWSM